MNKDKAILALADGTIFEGKSIGAKGEVNGEIVLNTSMTGYQEILTDPSYAKMRFSNVMKQLEGTRQHLLFLFEITPDENTHERQL